MPEETKHMPSQDVADSERSGDRRLSTCSASWVVQRWSQYKLGRDPFNYCADADQRFKSEMEAMDYVLKADSGLGGDTRYRYVIIPLPNA
jgi:hypothetical protein